LGPKDHQQEMARRNGHVTDEVTWPWTVKVVTPICICLGPSISQTAADRFDDNGAPIGNGYLGIKRSRDRWHHVSIFLLGTDYILSRHF